MKSISRVVMALFYIAAGLNHFLSASLYREVMPPVIPWPLAMVYLSGLAEILLGAAVLPKRTRRLAGWGLIALLVAVFPANIHMALHGFRTIPEWLLWARLPLQAVFIWWAYAACLACDEPPRATPEGARPGLEE